MYYYLTNKIYYTSYLRYIMQEIFSRICKVHIMDRKTLKYDTIINSKVILKYNIVSLMTVK